MRILFATTRGAGHFGPLVPLAKACVRAGHEVLAAGPPDVGPLAGRAGLPFAPHAAPPEDELTEAWTPVPSMGSDEANEYVVREIFARCHARAALPGMLETMERWQADVVVRESCEFSSRLAAERLGTPELRLCVFLSSATDDRCLNVAAPVLDELRNRLGLARDPGAIRARGAPIFSYAPLSLEDARIPGPAWTRRFREPVPDSVEPLPGGTNGRRRPLVYVSLGSEAAQVPGVFPDLYRAAIDALAELPVRVLMTVGHSADPARLGPLPPSVSALRWVEQAPLMRHVAAMVGHGGAGSTRIALSRAVPMALIPLFADQAENARRVAELGAGVALEGGPAAVAGLRRAVLDLLEDPSHRRAAARVADEVDALSPLEEAVHALEAMAVDRAFVA